MGIGTTCYFLCWEKLFSQEKLFSPTRQRVEFICGSVLSAFLPLSYLAFLQTQAQQPLLLLYVSVMAFVNLFILRILSGKGNSFSSTCNTSILDTNVLKEHRLSLVSLFVTGFISPILYAVSPTASSSFAIKILLVCIPTVAVALVVSLVWFFLKKNVTIQNTYILMFPVYATTFLLSPLLLTNQMQFFPLMVGSFGFILFSIVMMTSIIDIADSKRLRLTGVYSVYAAALYSSRIIGGGISTLITSEVLPSDTQIYFAALLLLYGFSLIMFNYLYKRPSKHVERTKKGTSNGKLDSISTSDPLTVRCQEIAQEFKLTKRQHEIMELFAHGYDIPAIAKKLYISENTVRTHTKRLYSALEIHSRQEIIGLINKNHTDK